MTEGASVDWWRVVPESAVLWRDCDECDDGYWPKRTGDSGAEQVFSRDRDCPTCGGSGRVRVGVCWIEPDEIGWLHEQIASLSVDMFDVNIVANRILALLGVKEK